MEETEAEFGHLDSGEDAGAVSNSEDEYAYESTSEDGAHDDSTKPANLHPDDPANFAKLVTAIKLLLSAPLTDAQITEGDRLLRTYCWELVEVCHSDICTHNAYTNSFIYFSCMAHLSSGPITTTEHISPIMLETTALCVNSGRTCLNG
jgi:hypothetical protein